VQIQHHLHLGAESFYVLDVRLGQRTPRGVSYVDAGQTMNGHKAGMVMEVFNAGTSNLHALIVFLVDATQPFSSPATLEGGPKFNISTNSHALCLTAIDRILNAGSPLVSMALRMQWSLQLSRECGSACSYHAHDGSQFFALTIDHQEASSPCSPRGTIHSLAWRPASYSSSLPGSRPPAPQTAQTRSTTRIHERAQELLSSKGLVQNNGGFSKRRGECREPGDHYHADSKVMEAVDQIKRHPISKFDIHDSDAGGSIINQSFSINRCCGCSGNNHPCFFENRLHRHRNMPVIFDDQDATATQTRRRSTKDLIHHLLRVRQLYGPWMAELFLKP
jgi:hypothetical protein